MERRVEAKYPALQFKLQLTTLVETMYSIIRENLKKDLTPLLSLAIQVHIALNTYNTLDDLKLRSMAVRGISIIYQGYTRYH